jgi:hypothetical protein
MRIAASLAGIERQRGSKVLVLAASNLEIELLPALHDLLRGAGRSARLDVLLYCRGGSVAAARRIALLLNEATDHLSVVVPHHCESAGTILALAAREILAGPVAIFSPVDPALHGSGRDEDQPAAIAAQDLRLFAEMGKDWFGLTEAEAGEKALALLCQTIFPATLTSFYRATREVEAICRELLALRPGGAGEDSAAIVRSLLFGHHSHDFPLARDDLRAIGLPVRADPAVEELAWQVAGELRAGVGGAARETEDDDWVDALLATPRALVRRRRRPGVLAAAWEPDEPR